MKRLYLMRHGHSPTATESGVKTDALRPLSDKGLRDARRMAEEIARRGGIPSLVLHSPLVRAALTARTAAASLNAPAEALQALDNVLPADQVLAALLARGAGVDEVLAVGHQPQLGELSVLLADSIFEIHPAGVVAVEWAPEPRLLWSANVEDLA
jgi:phosphohistidine phosphatase